MVLEYNLNDSELILMSDKAAGTPIYVYISSDKKTLLYSKSIIALFDHDRVETPLEVTDSGISFLLQSGVVPPPNTVYKNIYIVSIGIMAVINTIQNNINISFNEEFPFLNSNRQTEFEVNETAILELLAIATKKNLKSTQESYLFHSAGKDSNMIALAIAEAGFQKDITCITHKSKGEFDESEISKEIAKKLGFEHLILNEPAIINSTHTNAIWDYFKNIPFPCMDNIVLAYPLYTTQLDFNNVNIIDGMGSDVFIGHVPSRKEYNRQKFSFLSKFRPYLNYPSGTIIDEILSSRAEHTGIFGLSPSDSKRFFLNAVNMQNYWRDIDNQTKHLDFFDLKAFVKGAKYSPEVYTRKVRNLSDVTHSNLVLPWTDPYVATYFSTLPENILFDRKSFKNKLLLRKILKEKIDLDSDKLGKKAFEFDFYSLLLMMKQEVNNEILTCGLWDSKGISAILDRLYNISDSNSMFYRNGKYLIHRLFIISLWFNQNKYVKKA